MFEGRWLICGELTWPTLNIWKVNLVMVWWMNERILTSSVERLNGFLRSPNYK